MISIQENNPNLSSFLTLLDLCINDSFYRLDLGSVIIKYKKSSQEKILFIEILIEWYKYNQLKTYIKI